ncbi:HNH endonuclease [Arthrobacter sp. MDT1-65]
MKGYYEESGDERRAYMAQRREDRPDHLRSLDNARYERDKDKRIALATEHSHLRRARLKDVASERGITVLALRKIHGDNCCYCGIEMDFNRGPRGTIAPDRATLEHVLPISRGGTHTWDNAALACHHCNTSKNAKTLDEWSPNNGLISDRHSDLEACA